MLDIKISQLKYKSINNLIDDNVRFNIIHDMDDTVEDKEEEVRDADVINKIALLRE